MALSQSDLRLLKEILSSAHALEKIWPSGEARAGLPALKSLIASASGAVSPDLARLAASEAHLSDEMTSKHLAAFIVPFERLQGRALRDDEFIVEEGDQREAVVETGPLRVIVDNIRSAFNVGAILRTAECFATEKVILTGYTPTPEEEKTSRTSMGAQDLVAWESVAKAKDAIARAKSEGYEVVALETAALAVDLADFAWPERTVLLLGNERFGIDKELLAEADHLVRIPLKGRKNSLNVGIAFGIAAADWREKLEKRSRPLAPVGHFRCSAKHPYEARRQGTTDESEEIGWVELGKGFEQTLSGLEGFSRVWLVYGFDRNTSWKPMVMPKRGPRIKRGVFATRSPYRPNFIGLSCVELFAIEGTRIAVKGFDLLDGSPIYDIKPYLPYADSFPDAKAGWTMALEEEAFAVFFSEKAEEQLAWLEERKLAQARGFFIEQLSHDPLDAERKRVAAVGEGRYRLSYRTWRADFEIENEKRAITIVSIASGYSPDDLALGDDKYQDKDLHRSFLHRFS